MSKSTARLILFVCLTVNIPFIVAGFIFNGLSAGVIIGLWLGMEITS